MDSSIQNELALLVTLQNHDNILDELKDHLEAVEQKIRLKNQEIESLKIGSKSAKEVLTALQMKRKQLEGEAESQETVVKKHQASLNSLKTNDAYKAMLGEIDAAKKAQTKIEDDILILMEQAERQEKNLKELETRLKTDEGRFKSELQILDADRATIAGELRKKTEDRDAYAQTLPAALKDRYESVRRTKGGVAIVAAVKNTCTGCRMKLPPNKTIEVKKATHMVVCDNCSRILYIPAEDNVNESSPTATPPPAVPSANISS